MPFSGPPPAPSGRRRTIPEPQPSRVSRSSSTAISDPPPCSAPEDIPWLSVSPTAGSTPPAGSTPVDVTFDSTGIPVGTLGGTLCIFSNDPDEPLVPVPVVLEVVIPVELQSFTIE